MNIEILDIRGSRLSRLKGLKGFLPNLKLMLTDDTKFGCPKLPVIDNPNGVQTGFNPNTIWKQYDQNETVLEKKALYEFILHCCL